MTTALDELFGLKGKVAVVTGGASGIGLASAELFAAAGATVVVVDRDAAAAEQALAKIGGRFGPGGLAFGTDVAKESEIEATTAAVEKSLGRIDILVNSAGTAIRRPATEVSVEDWDKVMNVNTTGTFLFSRAVARGMIARGEGGSIVQISSIMGFSGGGLYPNISYQTSKGAVVNMTRALAVEWAPHRIRVNAVGPTYVKTPFIAGLVAQPELVQRIEAMTPLRRIAEPVEIASAVLYLASPAASMVTGHTLMVDGGFMAQ
ncbi:SDR family NAD(P)-dependent oxidoreductase [Dongia sp.]|uniref:SDR family NAD(P)-dependent oxidoreductase n=1 Tax=Dongia sp. TaxID=1977262 RepID=UPI003752C463